MDVIGHHDIGVKPIVVQMVLTISNRIDGHAGNLGSAQVQGPGRSPIQEPVHGDKSSSGGAFGRKNAMVG